MDDFDRELKMGFLDEAEQGLADVEQCFLALEANPADQENLNKVFRLAHNLKGSSKAVGFDELGHFTHQFESFILRVKNGQLQASPSAISLMLKANDHILKMVQELRSDLSAKFDSSELLSQMSSYQDSAGTDVEQSEGPASAGIVEAEGVLESGAEPEFQVTPSPEAAVITESESSVTSSTAMEAPEAQGALSAESGPQTPSVPAAQGTETSSQTSPQPAATEKVGKASAPNVDESIRVSLAKVESLINFVGEMVILQSVLKEISTGSELPALRKSVQQLGKVGKEIQDISMSLRMVPVRPVFQKMQRIVRDTSHALGKQVHLSLQGEETELDKTVLERIGDPLVHLVRNAVDHGIESTEQRTQSGKSPQGHIKLSASQQSGRLVLEVSDDGGGLNAEKLKRKAIEKGILKPNAQLSEREAFALIFAPGFSTKENVTDVSGRGVGMDVVKTNIQDLGGEVQIESQLGQGTTFRIVLPLSLSIIDGMVVSASNERFVIPLGHVYETLGPRGEQIQQVTGVGDVLLLRGENLPLYRLGDFLGLKSSLLPTEMIALVFRIGPRPFALLVDDIIGQSQVVTKPLSPELAKLKGVSGTTILGDGRPALILEPLELIKKPPQSGYVKPASVAGGKAA